jgi:hypothetical protein
MKLLYCEKGHFPFFEDYVNTFINQLNLQLMIVDNYETVNYNQDDFYFFLVKLPQRAFSHPRIKAIYINTEQLSRKSYLTYCQTISKYNIPIIDYSEGNHSFMPNSTLLRYQYHPEEINRLSLPTDKIYDVAFVGYISSRREKILNQLKNDGLQVRVVNGWLESRDKEICKAKVLLNIHYNEEYNVYEALRCDRFLFSGMIVVTETSICQELIDVNDLLIVEDYQNLVSRVKDVIQNFPQYVENMRLKREKMLPSIIESRKGDLIKIKKL